MSSKTVAGKTTVATGARTINSVVVNTASFSGRYSIHDCAQPWQVELVNCIWPIGAPSPERTPMIVTVPGKSLVASGRQTVKEIAVVTASTSGRFSIHDCTAPNFATLTNQVWPFSGGGGSAAGPLVNGTTLHVDVTVKRGLVLHTPDDAAAHPGSYTLTLADPPPALAEELA